MEQQEKNPPYKTIRAGKISIALWKKEVEQEGRGFIQRSARIEKRYFNNKTGNWETTEYLYRQDMADLIACAQKAFEEMSVTETDNNGQ
jgi:hypothetical protein